MGIAARMNVKFTIVMFLLSTGVTLANPLGEWRVADGTSKITIKKCGPNLCGKISWTADGDDLGKLILIDMQPAGLEWKGTIVDPRDGKQYLGRISLQNETQLQVDGCVMGGAFCGGEVWSRTR